jgi:hypothetical protein
MLWLGRSTLRRPHGGAERIQTIRRAETLLRVGAETSARRTVRSLLRRLSPTTALLRGCAVRWHPRVLLRRGWLPVAPPTGLSRRRRSTVPAAVLLGHGGGRRRSRRGLGRTLLNGRPTRQAELVRGLVLGAATGADNHRKAPVREHCPGLVPRQAAPSIAPSSPSRLVLSLVSSDSTRFSAPFPGRRSLLGKRPQVISGPFRPERGRPCRPGPEGKRGGRGERRRAKRPRSAPGGGSGA